MPYIVTERRAEYDEAIAALVDRLSGETPSGELNYILTCVTVEWIRKRGLTYSALAAAVGVLETAKLELYRRVGVPYEDGKIQENGDVYG